MSKNKLSKFAEVHALPNVVEVPYAELLKADHMSFKANGAVNFLAMIFR